MTDDLVVLWSDRDASHDLCYEIVEIGEGEFELRVLCDGRLWMSDISTDFEELIERARALRADLHVARL